MKCMKIDLSKELEEIEIEIFSDLHIGSKKCDYQTIVDRINRVKNNENVYAIILGDLLNNSTKTSVGDVYEEELSPNQQLQKAIHMFEPIKDKIIGITAGNHERRTMKQDNVDLIWVFADELGLAHRYDYCACLLFIKVGNLGSTKNYKKVCYSMYMTHGDGQSARTVGGRANGLQKRGQIVDADIVVTGHTHQPLTFRDSYYRVDYANSTVKKRDQMFVNASATLDYEEYAELYGMKPSSKVSPVIVLNGKRHMMTTRL